MSSSRKQRGPVPVTQRSSTGDKQHSSRKATSCNTSSHHRKPRSSTSSSHEHKPRYELTLMTPLPTNLSSNVPFQPAYLITSTRSHPPNRAPPADLLGVISLVPSTPSSPTSTSSTSSSTSCSSTSSSSSSSTALRGPSLVSSLHALPESYLAQLPRHIRRRARGYVAFPDLSVVVPGAYELGVALLRVPTIECGSSGGTGAEVKTVGAAEGVRVAVC